MTFVRAQASDGVGRRPRQDPILGAKTKGMFHSSKAQGLGMPTSRQTAAFRKEDRVWWKATACECWTRG